MEAAMPGGLLGMLELTPEQMAQRTQEGIGPPTPEEFEFPGSRGDTSAPLLAFIAQTAGQTTGASDDKPQDPQVVGGIPYAQDPEGYGFGPFYNASPTAYADTNRGAPLTPPEGLMDKPDAWKAFYTPNDRSTGGGFFLAADAFPNGIPHSFQEGASSPSTNNWRLFGGTPGQVMRNGRIINLRATDLRGPGWTDGPSNRLGYSGPNWSMGSAETRGYPAGYSYGLGLSFAGWPGSNNWASGGIGTV
jgi:hypothetical protein